MSQRLSVQHLRVLAIISTVIVLGVLAWDHIRHRNPNAAIYQAAADAFDDGNWSRARDLFRTVITAEAGNLGARRGLANSLVQMAQFDAALRTMNEVIAAEPDNGCNYATRGIIQDHRGRHTLAIGDYDRAVRACPDAINGMSWMRRVLTNTHEQPPTISERLGYLRRQMALPQDQRVLRVPELDDAQKPWKG